ncbi:MAG: aminomethyl-transferring glycine dehydrogenase subunit GcvPB [Candidatus Aureabacteria bacterium]|nr:aminomethyl-transferring glycine dehydrogenase subunit GcvPB [Candidatus Auribacterota bacterium]
MKRTGLIFEKSVKGRKAFSLPAPFAEAKNPADYIPAGFLRSSFEFPEISELDIVRHYTNLASKNFSVDGNFYPLGSCTMKYNPKINEQICAYEGFRDVHPLFPCEKVQGYMSLLKKMERLLCSITGMDEFCLHPSAGAHGELLGLMLIRAFHDKNGDGRKKIIVPDSSHGTNPSSAAMAGYRIISIKSDAGGQIDLKELKNALDGEVAALMMTNPNTLGLFEDKILEIAGMVHEKGALLYYDGANLNPLLGLCRPGDMGFDVVHLNLHKTFATPHGGGGPGSGPVGVKKRLEPFLPVPVIRKKGDNLKFDFDCPDSIGMIKAFWGNTGVILKAFAYITALGDEGLKKTGEISVLNANYLRKKLGEHYNIPFNRACMHEFVISVKDLASKGIHAIDIAKALIDRGIHPPTVYFPMIVEESIMVEPTETESKSTLDCFIDEMVQIHKEAGKNPGSLKNAPVNMGVRRLDELRAAKFPDVKWDFKTQNLE